MGGGRSGLACAALGYVALYGLSPVIFLLLRKNREKQRGKQTMDLSASWSLNWDLFVEIGAGSSICTRLTKKAVPAVIEKSEAFRRLCHYAPVFAASLFLLGIWLFPDGGRVVLHAITIGGLSGNLRDVFAASLNRLAAGSEAEPSPVPSRPSFYVKQPETALPSPKPEEAKGEQDV